MWFSQFILPLRRAMCWGMGRATPYSTFCFTPGPPLPFVMISVRGVASGWSLVMDQLSLSIFSSNMIVVARALQWASLTSASSILANVPCLPLMGFCFTSGEYQQILTLPTSLVAHPLSSLGSFSKTTLHL